MYSPGAAEVALLLDAVFVVDTLLQDVVQVYDAQQGRWVWQAEALRARYRSQRWLDLLACVPTDVRGERMRTAGT